MDVAELRPEKKQAQAPPGGSSASPGVSSLKSVSSLTRGTNGALRPRAC